MSEPVGGVKVFFKHVEILNSLGFEAYIYHPRRYSKSARSRALAKFIGKELDGLSGKNHFHKQAWFSHQAPLRPNAEFDPPSEFVMIPEIWAPAYAQDCIRKGLKYGIFVQGGYLLDSGLTSYGIQKIEEAYRFASLIVGISDDTLEMVRLAFPFLEDEKIVRVLPHISPLFAPAPTKESSITFMPRKMSHHLKKVEFFLRHYLPEGWVLKPIDGIPETEVANLLSRSKIFLSLCEMEGCPLPPLEAAFSGNLVVGYTGQGAKEYFNRPIFREVEPGNISAFVQEVLTAIHNWAERDPESAAYENERLNLIETYGEPGEIKSIERLYKKINQLFECQ